MKLRIVSAVALLIGVSVAVFSTRPSNATPQPVLLTGSTKNSTTGPGERSGTIFSAAFAPDGKTLASGDQRGQVFLWDTTTHKRKANFTSHNGYVRGLAWSSDGKELVSAGEISRPDGSVGPSEWKIWNVATGKPRFALTHRDFFAEMAAWSPDGKVIALGGTKRKANDLFPQIELRDAATGRLLRTITLRNDNKGSVNRLQFSPDSKLVLTLLHWVCEGKLWDVKTGELVRDVKPSPELKLPFADDVFAFSSDSKMLARGQFDGGLIVEDTRSGAVLRTFAKQRVFGIREVRFAPNGKTLWSMATFEHFTWDMATGEMLSKTRIPSGGTPLLSHDGSLLAGYENQNLYLTHLTP